MLPTVLSTYPEPGPIRLWCSACDCQVSICRRRHSGQGYTCRPEVLKGFSCEAPFLSLQDTVYFVKGAFQEELMMQGRGKEPQAWLDSFDAVTPCIVQEVRS